jgi:hypothetical protein
MAAAVGSLTMRSTTRPAMTPGVAGGGALLLAEVGRHGDDGPPHGHAERRLGVLLEAAQDHR